MPTGEASSTRVFLLSVPGTTAVRRSNYREPYSANAALGCSMLGTVRIFKEFSCQANNSLSTCKLIFFKKAHNLVLPWERKQSSQLWQKGTSRAQIQFPYQISSPCAKHGGKRASQQTAIRIFNISKTMLSLLSTF